MTFETPPTPGLSAVSSKPDPTLSVVAHLGGLFGSVVAPVVVLLASSSDTKDAFTRDNAREALNFQITLLIGFMVSFMLMFVLIGFFTLAMLGLANLILSIVAAVKAGSGEVYRYPLTWRLIK